MTTIHDVARIAGVSISTVSYALSGKRSIAESTRRRVEEAARQLDYRPNAGARMLAGNRTYILAVTEPLRADTYAPAHMAFFLAVATAARRYDYDILLLTQEEAAAGLRRVTSSRLVDGFIVLDVASRDERTELARTLGIPSVFVGVPDDTEGLVCVDLDFEAAGALAVDTLADAGHRVVGLLGHPQGVYEHGSNFPPRLRDGFLRRAAERGLEARFAMPEADAVHTAEALDALLGPDQDLTGLVMHCQESVQSSALDDLRERGLRIPDDLSVIAAATTLDTSRLDPPIDAVPLVPAHSCDRAVELAIEQLTEVVEPRVELIAPTYTPFGSVTPRPTA